MSRATKAQRFWLADQLDLIAKEQAGSCRGYYICNEVGSKAARAAGEPYSDTKGGRLRRWLGDSFFGACGWFDVLNNTDDERRCRVLNIGPDEAAFHGRRVALYMLANGLRSGAIQPPAEVFADFWRDIRRPSPEYLP